MAEVNYVNPAAFQPQTAFKPSGPLAGVLMSQQINDYNQIMGVQHQLQNMGLQEQAMRFGEFQQEAPLRAMQRDTKMGQLQAERPFIAELARSGAQNKIASQDFERETKFSPQNKANFFDELKRKSTEEQWNKIKREMEVGFQVALEAKKLSEKNGATAAMAHVQRRVQQAKAAGIELPEELFMDPRAWDAFIRAGVENQKFMQQTELQTQKDEAAGERAEVNAESRLGAANINAASRLGAARISAAAKEATSGNKSDKPPTGSGEIAYWRKKIADLKKSGKPVDDATADAFEQAIESAWDKYEEKNVPDPLKRKMRSPKQEVSSAAKAEYGQIRQQFLQRHGVSERAVTDGQIANPQKRPPLGTFLK